MSGAGLTAPSLGKSLLGLLATRFWIHVSAQRFKILVNSEKNIKRRVETQSSLDKTG